MLLAIDVGNTHTVFAVWHEERWAGIWRRATSPESTEDELAVWLRSLFDLESLPWRVERAICASVAPAMNDVLDRLAARWLRTPLTYLRDGASVGLEVDYDPPGAVGADRIANALGALERFDPPLIVVDFGTATTLDAVDGRRRHAGGAILPGVKVASQALYARAAKLPLVEQIPFSAPPRALGKTTVESLQSGIMFGYAGGVDAIARRLAQELGGRATVLATGGLGERFLGLCETLQRFEPNLTLDGLRVASRRLHVDPPRPPA